MSDIKNENVVEIDYTLKNDQGAILDSSEGAKPLSFIMGKKNIIPGLEAAIGGKSVGDSFQVEISPKDAYGEKIDGLIQSVPKSEFGENADKVEVGHQFQVQNHDGQPMIVQVIEVNETHVVLDGNHPMAGQTLHFDVKIISSREATPEELERGHMFESHGECDPDGGCC